MSSSLGKNDTIQVQSIIERIIMQIPEIMIDIQDLKSFLFAELDIQNLIIAIAEMNRPFNNKKKSRHFGRDFSKKNIIMHLTANGRIL